MNDTNEYPSFYAWPEWQEFRARFGNEGGALGHGSSGPSVQKADHAGYQYPSLVQL